MRRISNNMSTLKVIDLFSGAGGLSYGFEQAGAEVVLAIEKDAWAVETYKENHNNKNIIEADINDLDDAFFENYKNKVDVVMGGPPCQGFSIAASNRRKMNDSRNVLYRQFLRVVVAVNPKIVLIENVKKISDMEIEHDNLFVGKGNSYVSLSFTPNSFDTVFSNPNVYIHTKDQDFVLGVNVGIEVTADGSSQSTMTVIPVVAIECKTYLERNMLDSCAATAGRLKNAMPYCIYI